MPKGYSKLIHLIMLLLSVFGAVMVTSASMSGQNTSTLAFLIVKQFGFIFISYALMIFFAKKFQWKWFVNTTNSLLFIIGFFIIFLLIPRLFFEPIYGSYNWISIPGGFSIQPSEISKPFIIVIISSALGGLPVHKWMFDPVKLKRIDWKTRLRRVWKMIYVPLLGVIIMMGIILFAQNDFGTFMIILVVAATIVFMASHPFITGVQRVLLGLFVLVLIFGVYAMTPGGIHFLERLGFEEYQLDRITALYTLFERDRVLSTTMQQVNGLLAFAKGGLLGNGLGSSILKFGYIPEQDSDYILAILIDEFGFVGFLLITLGYAMIMFVLFKNAFKIKHQPSRLFLIGAATYIFVHYLFNVGGTSGLVPLTGVPLLLISAGGSSQMGIFITMGIAQNIIARNSGLKAKKL